MERIGERGARAIKRIRGSGLRTKVLIDFYFTVPRLARYRVTAKRYDLIIKINIRNGITLMTRQNDNLVQNFVIIPGGL